jgi:hypothetical protein
MALMARFACPACRKVLEHPEAGATITCRHCGQALRVPRPDAVSAAPAPAPPGPSADGPRRLGSDRDEERCHECGGPIRAGDQVCAHCAARQPATCEEDEDVPPGRWLPPGVKPHRGGIVLALGVSAVSLAALGALSLLTCCALPFLLASLPLGPLAWVMGRRDLKEMRAGTMDRSGEGQTRGGLVCAIIATALSALILVLYVVLMGGVLLYLALR